MQKILINTDRRENLLNITSIISEQIKALSWQNGILFVHCPHSSAGLTINESADPNVRSDICQHMEKLVPAHAGFKHAEGNSDSHIKSSLFGPQLFIFLKEGLMQLGTWQAIYFCEWDGPRKRNIWLKFMQENT